MKKGFAQDPSIAVILAALWASPANMRWLRADGTVVKLVDLVTLRSFIPIDAETLNKLKTGPNSSSSYALQPLGMSSSTTGSKKLPISYPFGISGDP